MSAEQDQKHELPEFDDLEPIHEEPEAEPASRTGGARGGSTLGQKRDLEEAPLQLRKASKILFFAGLLPMAGVRVTEFAGGQFPWAATYIAKAIALVGMWLFYQGYVATHQGESKIAALDKFAKAHHLVMPIVATVISLVAFWFLVSAPGFEGATFWAQSSSFVEVGTLILASVTFCHIFGYEHGGKFNPIFPLMFLGPGVGGVFALFIGFKNLADTTGSAKAAAAGGLLGQVIAAVGGLMAMWIMYKAMKQAKVEGDLKRVAAREARAAARASSGSGDGGGRAAGSPRPRQSRG
jgi:hypothetical protein